MISIHGLGLFGPKKNLPEMRFTVSGSGGAGMLVELSFNAQLLSREIGEVGSDWRGCEDFSLHVSWIAQTKQSFKSRDNSSQTDLVGFDFTLTVFVEPLGVVSRWMKRRSVGLRSTEVEDCERF